MGAVAVLILITAVITAVGMFCKQKKSTKQPEPIELKEKGQ